MADSARAQHDECCKGTSPEADNQDRTQSLMVWHTIVYSLDLMYGFYHNLMCERDIPYNAVRALHVLLLEWLVRP